MKRLLLLTAVLAMACSVGYAGMSGSGQDRPGTGGDTQQRITPEIRAEMAQIRAQARQEAANAESPQQRREIYQNMAQQIRQLIGDLAGVRAAERARSRGTAAVSERPVRTRARQRAENQQNDGSGQQAQDAARIRTQAQNQNVVLGRRAAQMMMGNLALTQEQRQAMAQLEQQAEKQVRASLESVLTDEQFARLQQMRRRAEQIRMACGADVPGNKQGLMLRIFDALDLTEEQKLAIREICDLAIQALREVTTPEEKRAIMEQARADILEVLTDEQLLILEEMKQQIQQRSRRRGGPEQGLIHALDLTEEQLAEIAEIRARAKAALADAETPEERQAILEAARQAILDVFTDEQIEQLQRMLDNRKQQCDRTRDHILRLVNLVCRLDLTEEQIAEIQAIRDRAVAALQDAETPEQRLDIIQAAREAILDVLTEEQLAQFERLQQQVRDRDRVNRP